MPTGSRGSTRIFIFLSNVLRWVKSEASKSGAEADIAKYDGKWEIQGSNETFSLVMLV